MSSAAPSIPFGGIPRVNLIPRSELDRRERASTARKWIWGVVGAILASLALIAGAMTINWLADQRLLVEQARTNALLTELASLSEVSGAIASERDLIDYRAQAAGSDFAWAPVVAELRRALPSGVELVGFALTTGGVPQGEDPAAEVGVVGRLTLSSPNANDIAQTVRAMRALTGVADADGRLVSTSQQSVGAYTYEISVAFDQSIYSGRFVATEGEQ
jgi:hypothetical protein